MTVYNFDIPIERRTTHSTKWNWFAEDVLPMWVADMDFVSPEPVIRALRQRADHGVYGYQFDSPPLRALIVDRLAQRHAMHIDPSHIIFLPGLVVALNLICRAFGDMGAGVIAAPPIYPPFLSAPGNGGRVLQSAPMIEWREGSVIRCQFDFDALEAAITPQSKIFLLCNPHNPTGRVFTRAELEQIGAFALKHDLLIVSDEIHCDLVFAPNQHISIASISPEIANRTITLIAPSKTFNVAGLSCGMAVIPNDDLRAKLMGMVWANGAFVNLMGFTAAEAAYRDGQEWLDHVLAYLADNRDYVSAYVRDNMPDAAVTHNEGTYLAWIDFSRYDLPVSPQQFFLEHAKVGLNDGATFGTGGEGHVRLNFACPRSLLEVGLDRMCRSLKSR